MKAKWNKVKKDNNKAIKKIIKIMLIIMMIKRIIVYKYKYPKMNERN